MLQLEPESDLSRYSRLRRALERIAAPGGSLAIFDFVSESAFRESLASDYKELEAARKAGAWKAVHVLAGSIVETMLIDYLVATTNPKRPKKDPLGLTLGEAIKMCRDEDVLSERTAALATVVQSYRNLIHPGRAIRLGEPAPDEANAAVAAALVQMIANEVGKARAEELGMTAEQLCAKLDMDSSAVGILPHLLENLSPGELSRLILEVLPNVYVALLEGEDPEAPYPKSLEAAYRLAFEKADAATQKQAVRKIVAAFREETGARVIALEEGMLRGTDLILMTEKERSLVKDHLIARYSSDRSVRLAETMMGIGPYLTKNEVRKVTWSVLTEIVSGKMSDPDLAGRALLEDIRADVGDDGKATIDNGVNTWIGYMEDRKNEVKAEVLRQLRDELATVDIPF